MKQSLVFTIAALFFGFVNTQESDAHCQVPCGIYTDDTVFVDLHTHQQTIAKAMTEIEALRKDPSQNAHQLTRWIMNKESHAQKLQNTITDYFLAQRLKPEEMETNKEAYLKKLTLCHEIIVLAMKCKQTADSSNAKALHDKIHAFEKAYKTK